MAFLLDKGIAAESEEEFDAETDRYEELRSRLLDGQTMKYEEMEELLAAAKARNDQKVIDVLKNVVDDPATDAVTESEKEPTKAELLDKLIKMCKEGSGVRIALEEIKDKFALDEAVVDEAQLSQEEMDDIAGMFAAYSGMSYGGDDVERRERARETAAFMQRHAGELRQLLDQPSQAEGFGDFSRATDLEFDESENPDFDTGKD